MRVQIKGGRSKVAVVKCLCGAYNALVLREDDYSRFSGLAGFIFIH